MPVVASILWRRLDAPGHDACRLERIGRRWRLRGVAAFGSPAGPTSVAYALTADENWRTSRARVAGAIGARRLDVRIAREDDGWRVNGARVDGLEHLVDLDFGFTPATNLIQLKRVVMPSGVARRLPVAWFDLESGRLTELEQTYQRRSEIEFAYAAPAFDYRGTLEVAPSGFVRVYPGLWEAEAE